MRGAFKLSQKTEFFCQTKFITSQSIFPLHYFLSRMSHHSWKFKGTFSKQNKKELMKDINARIWILSCLISNMREYVDMISKLNLIRFYNSKLISGWEQFLPFWLSFWVWKKGKETILDKKKGGKKVKERI